MKASIIILIAMIWGGLQFGTGGAFGAGLLAFIAYILLSKKNPAPVQDSETSASGDHSPAQPVPGNTLTHTDPLSLEQRVLQLEQSLATLQNEMQQLKAQNNSQISPAFEASSTPISAAHPVENSWAASSLPTPPQEITPEISSPPLSLEINDISAVMPSETSTADSAAALPPLSRQTLSEETHDSTGLSSTEPQAAATPPSPQAAPSRPAPPLPLQPAEPDWLSVQLSKAFQMGKDWLLGGNTVVRVGILILFFGLAFLLKFAADNSMLPVELRFAGTAIGAIVLLVIGWRLRDKRREYALIMQGGGVGVLYLTAFTALKFAVIPAGFALVFLILVGVFSAILAIKQDARSLAVMGITGGFLAPILTSTGQGSHIALFSYFALLNAGIFAMAWYKTWRPLNLLGFVFTFGIATSWGALKYKPELLASTEPFLILFFLFYVGIALLYALRQQVALKSYVDGTLIFGTPLAAFGLQAALVHDIEFALAGSAVVLSAFYLSIAQFLRAKKRDELRLLFEALLALGVLFATLAIPLAFDARTTAASWAVEAAAIIWVSLRQERLRSLCCALALQIIAGIAFFNHSGPLADNALAILNSGYIGGLMLALSGLFSGYLMQKEAALAWFRPGKMISPLLAAWGLLWWTGAGLNEIWQFIIHTEQSSAIALFAAFSALLASLACKKWQWPLLRLPALALFPLLALISMPVLATHTHPLAGWGLLAWPLTLPLALYLLWRHEDEDQQALPILHTVGIWLASILIAAELAWLISQAVPEGVWRATAWPIICAAVLWLLASYGSKIRWPIARFSQSYFIAGAAPLAAGLLLWALFALGSDGNPDPLPYLPLLNPLDIALGSGVVALIAWKRKLLSLQLLDLSKWTAPVLLTLGFLWLNAELLRVFHHWGDEIYSLSTLLDSLRIQAVFALFWSSASIIAILMLKRFATEASYASVASRHALRGILLVLWAWLLAANFNDGSLLNIRYLPLLNLLELAQLAVLGALYLAWRDFKSTSADAELPSWLAYTALATLFIWFNGALLRGLHHLLAFPFSLLEALHSSSLQQIFMLAWGLFSLAALQFAKRDSMLRLLAIACAPVMLVMWLWTFYANLSQAGSRWPLINPLDLIQIGIFALLALWLYRVDKLRGGLPVQWLKIGAGATLFVWLNGVLLRTLHHWGDVPYQLGPLLQSTLVQAALSIFWTLLAFGLMLYATRKTDRSLWFSGAALLVIVVGKLFMLDLSRISGIERIISFIGVGVLLLIIGYLSPLPPKKEEP
ncbi:DUF2339 domain-containing protein [Iodobacter fluviatilis]|uniref:Membrane protein n=1 Tax=Iodobacter fluviatilis TaxID=537 RepID=A0A377QA60_9NEIS|nr:DUF2339 domain-containing protein [Iodobacter fluviatilis]TCU83680.1 putative membrane protein [Iodobacter fluviatilis]STQ91813.1 Predicted membrane protein [Iodobacter fluviatilis]